MVEGLGLGEVFGVAFGWVKRLTFVAGLLGIKAGWAGGGLLGLTASKSRRGLHPTRFLHAYANTFIVRAIGLAWKLILERDGLGSES